ncbi:MAG: hypothetical protein HFI76_07090 [Lachnospiraceae bacterium]|nr:hypothetical protein [Lachnospiraceae bacterium]
MKKRTRAAGILLTLVLAVTGIAGCGDTKKDEGNAKGAGEEAQGTGGQSGSEGGGEDAFSDGYGGKGRFLETELTLPQEADRVLAAGKLSDGSISVVGYNSNSMQYYLMNTKDLGDSWDSRAVQGMDVFYVSSAAIAPDGSAVLMDPYGEELVQVSPDGTATAGSLVLPGTEGENKNQVQQAGYTKDGTLIVLDIGGVLYRADVTQGTLEEVTKNMPEAVYYFGMAGNDIVSVMGSGVYRVDAGSGELKKDETLQQVTDSSQEPISGENSYPCLFTAGAEEDSTVYVNHEGLFFHKMGGSVNEQLINGDLVSLGDSSLGFIQALTVDDSTYLVLGSDSLGVPRMYRYMYDAQASAVPQKQLKVYALEDSVALQQAISYFQKENPDVFVKKIIGLTDEDGITAEDALRTLSTDIMAGNGPDVLILDGIPVESYVEKGILADIRDLVEEVEGEDGLFENIKEAYIRDGSIYEMPSRFGFSVVEGEAEAVEAKNSLEAFLEYAKGKKSSNADENVLVPMSASGLLHELYYADSAGWRKEDGSLEEEKLEAYLKAAKDYFDLDTYAEEEYNNSVENYTFRFGGMGGAASTVANFRLILMGCGGIGTISSFRDVQQIYATEAQIGGAYDIFGEADNGSFVPYVSVGIAAQSAENQEAREFVKGLLGKECQSASMDGFPVNRAAYQEHQKNQKEYAIGTSRLDGTSAGVDVKVLTEEQANTLLKQLESLKRPVLTDRVIQELIVEEGIKYLNGDGTQKEVADRIMQKVKLYLSE